MIDERAEFERWFADGFPGETEIVEDEVTRGMWQAWQARAACPILLHHLMQNYGSELTTEGRGCETGDGE